MAVKLGSTDINQIYLGSTDIKRAYLGSTLIHDTTVGGGGGINFVGGGTVPTVDLLNSPNPAASPLTLTYTPASADNVIIASLHLDSNVNARDTSIDSGGANLPTWNGNTMQFGVLGQVSRRHMGIYGLQAGTTSPATLSIAPANVMRGATLKLFEYEGVNTTTIFNASGTTTGGGDTRNPTLTTVDANGVLFGGVTWDAEGTASTVTTGTLRGTEGQSGGGARDIRHINADAAVIAAAATEGVSFNQTGNVSAVGCVVELNPA